jgi:outer membrane lipoprotein-sorting protein
VKQNDPLILEFVPLEKNISKKVIKSITITFREDLKYLKRIQIREMNGDVTTITFTNTQLNVPLDNSSFEVKG